MAQATVGPPTFLTMPFELRTRIYKEVFAGSEMRVKFVGGRLGSNRLLRCTNPERYKVLRTCKQIEQEGALVLARMTTLSLGPAHGDIEGSVDLLRHCNSSRAPRFLRQAVPCLRHIKLLLRDENCALLMSALSPFTQLRVVKFSSFQDVGSYIPDSIAKCPLLLLGTANDKSFVQGIKKGVESANRQAPPALFKRLYPERTIDTSQNVLKVLFDSPTKYTIMWESDVCLKRRSSPWEPSTILRRTKLYIVRRWSNLILGH
jgi:hypothetical protein